MKLKLKSVVVTQTVPQHTHEPGEACMPGCANSGFSCESWGTATYTVNLETGACQGEVSDNTFVSPVWWKEHCARVGQRVKATFEGHALL